MTKIKAREAWCPIGTPLHRQVWYYEEFKAMVAVVETYRQTFVEPGVVKKELTLVSVA